MDETLELFNAVARRDAASVRSILSVQPELARSKNADTLPVLVFARYMGSDEVFDALLNAGPALDVFEAAQTDSVDRLRELLDASPGLATAYSDDGFTALHLAAYYRAPGAVKQVLDRGADVEAVTKNFLSNMPIHAAAAGGRLDICEMLLDHGANVNARQHGGFTPLHTAGFRGDRAMAELFLRHGADASVKSNEGQTPAEHAASRGYAPEAAFLRAHETRP